MHSPEENGEQGTTAFNAAKNTAKNVAALNELAGEELEIATELVKDRAANATENDPNSPDYKRISDKDVAAEMADKDADKLERAKRFTRPRDLIHMMLGEHPLYPEAYDMMREVKREPAKTEEVVQGTIDAELTNQGHVLTEEKRAKMVDKVSERLKEE
jgi:hypothetical protein